MRRLLLTDCSQENLQTLANTLSGHYDVHTCCHGPDVLEEYLTFQPELFVLDTAMPGCDTVGLLHAVRSQDRETKVLAAACGFHSSVTDLLPMIPCLLIKPYDNRMIPLRLRELEFLLEQDSQDSLSDRINAILLELGIERNRTGFACLVESILYLHRKPDCLFTDDLYPYTAKVCGGSAQSVDKAMKRCIINAWRKRTPAVWAYYFGKDYLCPTNVHFIRTVARAAE